MATEKSPLEWFQVDVSSLPEGLKVKWAALEKANAAQKTAKAEFEAAFLAASNKAGRKLAPGKKLVVSTKWGTLSVAESDISETKTSKKKKSWF